MNSYPPETLVGPPPDDTDWSRQPTEDDPWVDVAAIQRRLDARNKRFGGLTVHIATFRMPWPCTKGQYEERRKAAGDKWVQVMERKGWTLRSKIHVSRPHEAYGTVGDWYSVALLDQREFHLRAAFEVNKLRPVRVELPVKVVKR